MTNDLRQRFCKDNRLNINVFNSPYFEERLEQFAKLPKFINILEDYKLFGEITKEYDVLKEIKLFSSFIINDITNKPEYQEMQAADIIYYPAPNIKTADIYNKSNVSREFVSIDLVKANFQVLKRFSNELVNNTENYKEFVIHYNKHFKYSEKFVNYLVNSKYLRQVLFGNMNPKKQQAHQKEIINNIINYLITNGVDTKHIISKSPDEVVVDCTDIKYSFLDEVKECTDLPYQMRIERFTLHQIENKKHFYKKDINGNIIDIKGVEGYLYAQVMRRLFNEEITENDLVFYAEKQLAKFLKPYI